MDESPQSVPPQPVHHTWEFALGISVLMLLMVGVVYIVQGQLQPIAEIEPTPVVADETANWKTYRNEELGFEFKYPSDLKRTENADSSQIVTLCCSPSSQDMYYPEIRVTKLNLELEEILHSKSLPPEEGYWGEIGKTRTYQLNGKKAYEEEFIQATFTLGTYIELGPNSVLIFGIGYYDNRVQTEEVIRENFELLHSLNDRIIGTLKFF